MITQAAITPRQYPSNPRLSNPAAITSGGDDCATLIADGMGRICSCGSAVEDIFGASRSRLLGKSISVFVPALFCDEVLPSDNVRYLAHLCADGEWQKFAAADARGRGFAVEIRVSRKVADGEDVFVLDLRRPREEP